MPDPVSPPTRSAALAHDPRHYNALYGLGQILLRQERPEQAVHKFAEASKISPGSSVLQCYLGIALARLGRHEQAIRVLQQAVQRDPRNPLARWAAGAGAGAGALPVGLGRFARCF